MFVDIDIVDKTILELVVKLFYLSFSDLVLAYWLLKSMRTGRCSIPMRRTFTVLRHVLSAKIIAGLPILVLLGNEYDFSGNIGKYIMDDLCYYVPGAYWDKNFTDCESIVKGGWMNCLPTKNWTRLHPDTKNSKLEIMLEQ